MKGGRDEEKERGLQTTKEALKGFQGRLGARFRWEGRLEKGEKGGLPGGAGIQRRLEGLKRCARGLKEEMKGDGRKLSRREKGCFAGRL